MATEAGITEVLLPTKGEGEAVSLTPVQFEKPVSEIFAVELKKCEESELKCRETETRESLAESEENKHVVSSTHVETVKDVISNSGTSEDASFLASASGPTVSDEEASRPEDYQVDKLHPLETVISENATHLEKVQQYGVLDEIVYEVDQNGKNHDVQSTIEASLEVVKRGEPKFEVEVDEAMKDEINPDRNVEVILNQQDSDDEGSRSPEEDTRDLEKDERGGKMEDSQAELASKESPREEATLDHKTEASVHNPDLTSPKDENIESTSSKEATLSKEEYAEQRSFEETKDEDKCIKVVTEGDVSEAIFYSKNTETEEKDRITVAKTEEVSSQEVENPEILKVHPEIGSECIDKESPTEVTEKTEIPGETTQAKGTARGDSNNDETFEQELDSLSRKYEEDVLGKSESLDITEAVVDKAQGTEGSGLVVAEEISSVKAIQEEELTELESIKHEKQTKDCLLPQNEPEDELQTHTVITEEAKRGEEETVTTINKEGEVKHLEESFKEQEEDEKGNEGPSEEIVTLPLIHSDKKAESTEAELTEADAGDLQAANFLVEPAEVQARKTDEALEAESHKEDKKSDEDLAKEEKHIADETIREIPEEEVSKSKAEDGIHEQESTKANVNKEQIIEGDVTGSATESVQGESIKTQEENAKDADKLNQEDDTAEIIKEGNVNDLSSASIQEDATKALEGHEHESEKSNKEVHEELETAGASESIPCETNKDIQSIVDESLVKEEKGNFLDPVEALIEEKKVESLKEEALKSRYEDESVAPESTEGNANKEQVFEREIIFSTSESVQEETSKSSHRNEKNEESTTEVVKEANVNDLPPDNIREDAIETLNDCNDKAETSKNEVVEELETAVAGESIPCETNKDVERSVDASSVKQEEGYQEEGKNVGSTEASAEDNKVEILEELTSEMRGGDESHEQSTGADFVKEKIIEEVIVSTPELIQEETSKSSHDDVKGAEKISEESTEHIIKKGNANDLSPETVQEDVTEKTEDQENEVESSKEKVVEELETVRQGDSIHCETNKDVGRSVDASLVEQEESQQEEGKREDPIEVSIEESKVEIPKDEPVTSRSEDESNGQSTEAESKNEQIIKEDTFPSADPFQEEIKSSHDNVMDEEKIIEESTAESIQEGNVTDFSQENIQEDETEKSKDHEDEAEKCNEEVVQELETPREVEIISHEANKDAESSTDASSVKLEESQQEEDKYLDGVEVSNEDNKVEDTFSTEIVKEDDKGIGLATEGGEDKQQVTQNDKPDEKLEVLVHVTPEQTETESSENSGNVTCTDVQETIENLHETSETSSRLIPQESDSDELNESIPCKRNEDVERSVASSVTQEEEQQECKGQDPEEESIVEDKKSSEVLKEGDENVVKVTEEGEEDQQKVTQNGKPDEKIENLVHGTPGPTEIEISENAGNEIPKELEGAEPSESISCKTNDKIIEESTAESIQEGNVTDFSQENIQEDETEKSKDHEDEAEKCNEEVVQELETPREVEIISHEANKDAESSTDASSVKLEESQQEEDKYLDGVEVSNEDNKVEDTFSTEIVKDDDKGIELATEGEEDKQHVTQNDKPDEKLEVLVHVTPEQTETESSENSGNVTCTDVEETIENLHETSETSSRLIPQESDSDELNESIPCKRNEDVERSVASSVTQEEEQQECKGQDPEEESIVEDKKSSEVLKEGDENVVKVTEEGEEDQQKVTQNDKPDEKIENLVHGTPEPTEIEISENAGNEIPKELEGAEPSESISCKTNGDVVERSVVTSSVKQEEEQQEDPEEESNVEDKISTVVKEDDESAVKATEEGEQVDYKGEEDQRKVTQNDKPDEKLENLVHGTPEQTEIESSENAGNEIPKELEGAEPSESIPCKTNEDVVERSVVTSSVKQEEEQQEDPEEESNVEDKKSTVVKEGDENAVKVTEEGEQVDYKGEEDQRKVTQNDKPDEKLENLVHGTPEQTDIESSENAGNEISKELEGAEPSESISCKTNEDVVERSVVTSSVKQEEEQQEDPEESNVEDKISTVVKEDDESAVKATEEGEQVDYKGEEDQRKVTQNDKPDEKLENLVRGTPEQTEIESSENAGNEIPKESKTAEESIPCKTNEYVVERSVVTSSVKQEEQQKESKGQDLEATLEEDSKVTEVVKEDDENAVKVTEEVVEVAYEDGVDQQQATKEHELEEKLENAPHVTPEETEMKSSIQTNITSREVEGTTQNREETSDAERKEEKSEQIHNENNTEKVVAEELETTEASESIPCETEEKKVEDTLSTKVVDDYDDNTVEATERTIDVSAKGEEDEKQATQKEEPVEKLQVPPEETQTEPSSEHVLNNTCIEVEGTNQNLEKISEPENKEEKAKNVDNANESEKEVIETTSASQETKEQVSREIDFVEEFQQKNANTETTEDTKESQASAAVEEQRITEPYSSSLQEEKVEESSKELDKEEGTQSEGKEQKVTDLAEEIKSESLEDSAKPNEDLRTTTTAEAHEEDKVAKETQEIETSLKESKSDGNDKLEGYDVAVEGTNDVDVQAQADSVSTENSSEEIDLKKDEPDNEELVKSYGIAPEEKHPVSSAYVIVQSSSIPSEIVSEETSLKEDKSENEEKITSCEIESEEKEVTEVKPDEEEKTRVSDDAPEEKDLSSSIDAGLQSDSVSNTVASEEASLKDAEPENEEQIRSRDVAPEDESLASYVVVDTQPDSVSTRLESEETILEEAELSKEEQAKSSNVAPEKKDLPSSIDAGLQSDSVSTTIASEETSLKEAEAENEEQIRSRDVASEDKGLESSVVIDTQPDSISTRLVSEETSSKEAELSKEEQIKSSDIAPEDKGLEIEVQYDSVPTETVSSETCVQEAEQGANQFEVSDIDPVEKSLPSSVDTDVQFDSISTASVNEEKKEAKEDEEDQVKTRDFAPEKKGPPSVDFEVQSDSVSTEILSKETGVEEDKHDREEQVDSSNIALEKKALASSLDTGSVIEERSLKEVKPDYEEQVADVAPEKKTVVDVEVQSDFVSDEVESEETCLTEVKPKNDEVESSDVTPEEAGLGRNVDIDVQSNSASALVGSEETDLKAAEPDYKEQVNYSDIASEEKVLASNDDGDVELKGSKLEEGEENKIHVITGEFDEKLEKEIDKTCTKEKETTMETPLDGSPEDVPKDSPTVPSTEHEPMTTEASDRSYETTDLDKSECEDEKLPTIKPEKEQGLLQQEDGTILESHDTEKEIESEKTREQRRDHELNIPPEIISKDVTPTEVHGDIEKKDENINAKEEATDVESITRELHPVSTEDGSVYEEKDSSAVLTEVIKATDSSEHTDSHAEKNASEKNEEIVTTVTKPEEEKLNDEEGTKLVDVCAALPNEGKIEEEIKVDVENKSDGNDTAPAGDETTGRSSLKSQLVDEPVEAFDEPESMKLEERSFELASEQPTEQKDSERENVTGEKFTASEVEETKVAPDTEDSEATSSIPTVEKPKTEEIKDETKEASEYKSVDIQEDDTAIDQAPEDGISKEKLQSVASASAPINEEHETETEVKMKQDITKEVDSTDDEKKEAELHEVAEERLQKEETEEDIKRDPEAAVESNYGSIQADRKAKIVADRDLTIGFSTEPVQVSSSKFLPDESKPENTSLVKKTEEENKEEVDVLGTKKTEAPLATEVAEKTKLKEDTEEDITKAPIEVSNCDVKNIEQAAEEEIVEKQAVQKLPPEEETDGTTIDEQSRTDVMVPETKEIKVSVEAEEEIKDASTTATKSDSQSTGIVSEEKTITCATIAEKSSEVQLVEQSDLLLPKEQDDETTTTEKETEEREKLKELSYENAEKSMKKTAEEMCSTEEEPRELEESVSPVEVCADKVESVTEASETVSKESYLEKEVIGRDISTYQAVQVDKDEIITETVSTTEKIEEDTKETKLLYNEVCFDMEEPKNESPEPLTRIEDVEIIENHLKVAAKDLGTEETRHEKTIEAGKTTAQEISHKEELSTETAQEKGSLNIEEVHIISREIKQPEESFNATYIEKTLPKAETEVTARYVEIPRKLVEATEEASPRDHTDREIKGGKEAQPAVISLSELLQDSKEEIKPNAENLTEETEEPKRSKEAENEKAKTDEEKDDDDEEHEEEEEHEESEHPDAPILVQSSKDIDAKASRKKSHGLFSGVGSKVKHSISKVKKAITGKSTHSKTQPSSS